MNKKLKFRVLLLFIISVLFTVTSCDSNTEINYPDWFNDYSGGNLVNLKAAQDEFDCFGNTIGSNVIAHSVDYHEDTKEFLIEFYTKDDTDLVDTTDIQPFRDGAIANGFEEDGDNNTYVKGNIEFTINVITSSAPDAHFEIMIGLDE
jgi:hypothetical protein